MEIRVVFSKTKKRKGLWKHVYRCALYAFPSEEILNNDDSCVFVVPSCDDMLVYYFKEKCKKATSTYTLQSDSDFEDFKKQCKQYKASHRLGLYNNCAGFVKEALLDAGISLGPLPSACESGYCIPFFNNMVVTPTRLEKAIQNYQKNAKQTEELPDTSLTFNLNHLPI